MGWGIAIPACLIAVFLLLRISSNGKNALSLYWIKLIGTVFIGIWFIISLFGFMRWFLMSAIN